MRSNGNGRGERIVDRFPSLSVKRDETLEEQLLNESGAMIRYTAAAGKRIPPIAAETVGRLDLLRAKHSTESNSAWRGKPTELRDLAIAHHLLSKVVAPATPQAITVLNEERPKNWATKLLGPVRLVRWMMILALVFLVTFLVLLATEGIQPFQQVVAIQGGETRSWSIKLWSALYILCAAGLGAVFANLFRANARIESNAYDPKEESSYSASIVMGMIAGVILARVLSGNFEELDKLTQPLLALLGGFAAPAVYRILTRLVDTVETLIQGNASEKITAQADAAAARANAASEFDRTRLLARVLRLRDEASQVSGVPPTIQAGLTSLLDEILPAEEGMIFRIPNGETQDAPSEQRGT